MPYADPAARWNYQPEWMARRREKGLALLGGKCVRCGSTRDLEFDHIDPNSKAPQLRSIHMGNFWSWSWKRIEQELAKCQLLCSGCHQLKTTRGGEHARG